MTWLARKRAAAAGAALFVALVSLGVWLREGRSTARPIERPRSRETPIGTIGQETSPSRAPVNVAPKRTSGVRAKPIRASGLEVGSRGDVPAEIEVTTPIDRLEAQWRTEPRDAEWTENVRAFASTLLETVDGGVQHLNDVNCGRSICRIELDQGDVPALLRIRSEINTGIPFAARQVVNEDGTRSMVAYIAREGQEKAVLSQ